MERVHLNFLGPFTPSSSGNEYILMVVCQFSKWIEAYPVKDCRTETVVRLLVDNFISRFGCLSQIHTDQGSSFTSRLFQSVCRLLEITKTRTTPYRPCSNGQVEWYNRTLLAIIRCYLGSGVKDWDRDLSVLTGSIRALPNRQTGCTPNMLMLGREVTQPLDLVFGDVTREIEKEPQYLIELRARLNRAHALAREKIEVAQKIQQTYYNANKRQSDYEPGDLVLMVNKSRIPGVSQKLMPVYRGPYMVQDVLTPVLLRVRDRKRCKVVHHDMIKRCNDRFVTLWMRRMRSHFLQGDLHPRGSSLDGSGTQGDDPGDSSSDESTMPEDHTADPSSDGSAMQRVTPAGPVSDGSEWDTAWIQCDLCQKWRRVHRRLAEEFGDGVPWDCSLNSDESADQCSIPEEDSSDWTCMLEESNLTYTVGGASSVEPRQDSQDLVYSRKGRLINRPVRFR